MSSNVDLDQQEGNKSPEIIIDIWEFLDDENDISNQCKREHCSITKIRACCFLYGRKN